LSIVSDNLLIDQWPNLEIESKEMEVKIETTSSFTDSEPSACEVKFTNNLRCGFVENFLEDFLVLETNSDVIIQTKDGVLSAHSIVLASHSLWLKYLLSETYCCHGTSTLFLPDFTSDEVKDYLSQLYQGQITNNELLEVLNSKNHKNAAVEGSNNNGNFIHDEEKNIVPDFSLTKCHEPDFDTTCKVENELICSDTELDIVKNEIEFNENAEPSLSNIKDETDKINDNIIDFKNEEIEDDCVDDLQKGNESDSDYSESTKSPELTLSCHKCDYSTHNKRYLASHLKTHARNENKPFFFTTMNQNELSFTKTSDDQYKCNHCEYTYHKRQVLERHLVKHLIVKKGEKKPMYIRDKNTFCVRHDENGKRISPAWNYFTQNSDDPMRYTCNLCNHSYKLSSHGEQQSTLLQHLRLSHDISANKKSKKHQLPDPVWDKFEVDPNDKQKYTCKDCGKKIKVTGKDPRNLRTHIQNQHTKNDGYTCSHCGKTFKVLRSKVLHEFRHNPPTLFCNHEGCEKAFHFKTELEKHLRTHTDERPYVCSQCGNSFRQRIHLETHMISHSDEKQFECSRCHLMFKHSSTLNKHKCSVDPLQ